MGTRWLQSVLAVSLLALASVPAVAIDEQAAKDQAVAAAKSWLALVDDGKYGESWDSAAGLFQAATTRANWEATLGKVRQPLGKVVARTFRSAQRTTDLQGAPAGEYVVIQYATSFENLTSAVETVTPVRDRDGAFKVTGYFIRPGQ
ncbi:MAG TPA: DUF4019 domain-containing protein [Thermoanaerobaculia bacterium]|nr:DUF4019 domain-containing protein [Thermoanaerobaculia bacterium]